MGGFSIWHWLIVLLIVVMVFGTKKLRNMGPRVTYHVCDAALGSPLRLPRRSKLAGTTTT